MARRPKPPPRNVTWTFTRSGPIPSAFATSPWAQVGAWVGAQSSAEPPRTSAVQFIGSIGACARSGSS
jgi:hypothetical protein